MRLRPPGRPKRHSSAVAKGVRWAAEIVIVAVIVVYFLRPQFDSARGQLHHLFDLSNPWLLLVIGGELVSLAAFALTTQVMIPLAVRPRFSRILRIDLSTIALSHSVPAGGAAGTGLGLRLLFEAGVPMGDASFAKLAQGLASGVLLQILLVSALIIAGPANHGSRLLLGVGVAGIVLMVGAGVLLFTVRRWRHSLAALVAACTRWLPLAADDLGHRLVGGAADSLDAILRDRQRMVVAAWSMLANWLFDALALWASVRAYGHSLSYLSLMIPFAAASTLTWLPITPGGVGIVEAALVPLLVAFGTPHAAAVLGVLTWRLVSFWLPIPIGGVAYASLSARGRSLSPQAPAAVTMPSVTKPASNPSRSP